MKGNYTASRSDVRKPVKRAQNSLQMRYTFKKTFTFQTQLEYGKVLYMKREQSPLIAKRDK
jgi:hypothetical protein